MKKPLGRALAKYRQFHGRSPEKVHKLSIPDLSKLVYLGEVLAVEYYSDKKMHRADAKRTGRGYRHECGKGVKVYTDQTGKALLIQGGRFHVTDWMRY